ncbi:MAG: hypothetical protein FJ027_23660, partial [Candidatus Rokubacteria bacterium]|nr:hypothetical protein [Candidatus Rokubacteria bacterium]
MIAIQALLAMVFRSAGRLLNTVFGWATVMLFGRVPQDRQIYLSLVSFGSVIWLITVVGIAFPRVGTFVLSFVPLPAWIDTTWVRLAMLAAALVIPAVVGVLATRLVDPEDRPGGAGGAMKLILRGYPYTVGLSLTLLLMTLFAPVLKVRDLLRRWTTQHVPVIVEPQDYPAVVDDVDAALRAGGIETQRGRPSWMLRFPTRLLGWFAGPTVGDLVAEELTRLSTSDGEILLHPSDMVISGRAAAASRMRAIVAEHLTFTRAYLTWDKEANEIEDALRRVWDGLPDTSGVDALARLRALESKMARLTLPYEEWEVLFRQKLQVERAALRRVAGLDERSAAAMDGDESTGLRRALDAVAAAVAEFRHGWKAERDG